jgi:hypothetical protein
MTTYPVRYIKREDLDKIHTLYKKNASGMDAVIQRVVEENQGSTGIDSYIGTAMKVRKGYPLYDKFGRKLSKAKKKQQAGLSGFGNLEKNNLFKLVTVLLVGAALFKMFKP